MGMASECSMGISAEPSASRIMSGIALAMTGDAVGDGVRREGGVVVVDAWGSRSGQGGVVDPTRFCAIAADTEILLDGRWYQLSQRRTAG